MQTNDLKKAHSKRFVFFGTPYVASRTLEALIRTGYIPEVVVTNPPAPVGRGRIITKSPTHLLAESHNIEVLTPEALTDDCILKIAMHKCDYAIVVAYGKILPQTLIDAFSLGILNIHYSLLPKYRGASPVEAALLHGDTVTGVAVQKMVFKMDAGDLLALREENILPDDTTTTLRARLINLGAQTLIDILPAFENGTATLTQQDESLATRCRKISKEEGELDLTGDAKTNWNTYRAYIENPGTYFFVTHGDKKVRVKIKSASFDGTTFTPLRVIPENKSEMDYSTFILSLGSSSPK